MLMLLGGGLVRQSAQPVHQQLSALLRTHASQLGTGGQLPTEVELMEQYQVSRTTVRRALDTLVEEGLLTRQRGKGTFVRPERMVHSLDHLRPFVSMFTEAGRKPHGKLLIHEWVTDLKKMPGPIAELGEEALHVRRLYNLEDVAPCITDIFVPKAIGSQITRADLEEHPVYQVIENKLRLAPAYADLVVSSAALSEDLAALDAPIGSPLLVLERTTRDAGNRMLECTNLYLRPDAAELRLRVQAEGAQGVSYNFSNPGPRLSRIDLNKDHATSDRHALHGGKETDDSAG